jgi:hypothetical protein
MCNGVTIHCEYNKEEKQYTCNTLPPTSCIDYKERTHARDGRRYLAYTSNTARFQKTPMTDMLITTTTIVKAEDVLAATDLA